jgi:hypothetical protein
MRVSAEFRGITRSDGLPAFRSSFCEESRYIRQTAQVGTDLGSFGVWRAFRREIWPGGFDFSFAPAGFSLTGGIGFVVVSPPPIGSLP